MSARAVFALVRKDLKVFSGDPRALVMSVVAPIAIASFFGMIFSGRPDREAARMAVRAVDGDGSAVSRAVVAGLTSDKALAVKPATLEEAQGLVRGGKVVVAVVIPPGFGQAAGQAFFRGAGRPELGLLYDPSHRAELGMVRGILTQHVMQAVSAAVFGGTQGEELTRQSLREVERDPNMDPADRAALTDMLKSVDRFYRRPARPGAGGAPAGLSVPFDVKEEAMTARADVPYNPFAHSFAGMGVQFLLFACIDLAIGILLERERGLWKRLRAAPLSRTTLLLGKATSGALIALATLWISFGFAMVVFRIRIQGSVVGFVAVSVAIALMASTFGLLVAALGRTPQASRGVAILAVLMMVMLGGAWVPSFVFPSWLQTATLVVPARWAVDGLDATTWRGASLLSALQYAGALLGFAALFGTLAVARFRWDSD
jgi:ABC-2 type transport system permease protein